MNRRAFLRAGCAGCVASAGVHAWAQGAWQSPQRFIRPESASEEGGLWALMDREEAKLRKSPFSLRDPDLRAYVQSIACQLAGQHCPDVRVYLMRVPYFNASMAPNGMMQVWSGLLLRVDNEAQLAAVLGHEIGHYLERHSLEQMRTVKSASAVGQFMGLLGPWGLLGQFGLVAGMYAYSRDYERDADRIGAVLMQQAGYDVGEASKIWKNLGAELDAKPGGSPSNPLFATHPPREERETTLAELATSYKGGDTREKVWQQKTAPFVRGWLADEVKRGQHEESLAFLSRALTRSAGQAEYLYARGEVYRLRAGDGDLDSALKDYQAAAAAGAEPPETYRAMGMIYRGRKNPAAARESFERYLKMAPEAPDVLMIRSYVEELSV